MNVVKTFLFFLFAIQRDRTFVTSLDLRINNKYVSADGLNQNSSRVFYAEIKIFRAIVCDADTLGAGDSDPYVKVLIGDNYQYCGETTKKAETNEPTFNELISCEKYPFESSNPLKITFDAYDDDFLLNGKDEFIGSGSAVIETDRGDYKDSVRLKNGNCNNDGEEGRLWFMVHLIDTTPPLVGTPPPTVSPTPTPTFITEIKIYRASVCDADKWGAGDSDPYVKVKIGNNQYCGETTKKVETNNPTFNEIIRCERYSFTSSNPPKIYFEAYDDDSMFNGKDDFIGSGSAVIETNHGEYDSSITLKNGNCNRGSKDGTIWFKVHLKQV